jgi:NACHT domain/TIR domain
LTDSLDSDIIVTYNDIEVEDDVAAGGTFIAASVAKARIAKLGEHVSSADRKLLGLLVDALGTERSIPVAAARAALFADRTDAAATKAFGRLLLNLADAAAHAEVDLQLDVRGAKRAGAAGRAIGFTTVNPVAEGGAPLTELGATKGNLVVGREALLGPEPRLRLRKAPSGKWLVRVFLSRASDDKKPADELWATLQKMLRTSSRYEFEFWDDTELLVGERWDARIRDALNTADLGVLAISYGFLGSPYITAVELPAFVNNEATYKRAIPVLLQTVDKTGTDWKGLRSEQVFRYRDAAFDKATGPRKNDWAQALSTQIYAVLATYASEDVDDGEVTDGPAPDGPALNGRGPDPADFDGCGPLPDQMGLRDFRALGGGFIPTEGRRGGVSVDQSHDPGPGDGQRVDVLEHLMAWAADPSRSLAAVLGEYGMGKTITCQAFTDQLRAARTDGAELPEPLYFDLRELANLRTSGTVPTLEAIIDEIVTRSWAGADGPNPTAAQLLDRAKLHPTLFVFDGLDEALVHLDQSQGASFTRELLKLRPTITPDGPKGSFAGEHTKVLISCRSHYFRSLQEQASHFGQQHRDRATADDYMALVLLPFTDEQVRQFLSHALPQRDVEQLMDLLSSVHDLSDLTTRPFTLARVAEQIPDIEARRMRGEQAQPHSAAGGVVVAPG